MKKYFIILMVIFFSFELFTVGLAVKSFLYPIKYEDFIKKYAKDYSLSYSLVASVINVESGYNKNAKSNAGAMGLMQLLPSTANYICIISNEEEIEKHELFTPEINIKIGCSYLRYLIDKFTNINTALASYNAGETVVRNWLKNTEYSIDGVTLTNIPYLETKKYIKKVNKNIKNYRNYKIYRE